MVQADIQTYKHTKPPLPHTQTHSAQPNQSQSHRFLLLLSLPLSAHTLLLLLLLLVDRQHLRLVQHQIRTVDAIGWRLLVLNCCCRCGVCLPTTGPSSSQLLHHRPHTRALNVRPTGSWHEWWRRGRPWGQHTGVGQRLERLFIVERLISVHVARAHRLAHLSEHFPVLSLRGAGVHPPRPVQAVDAHIRVHRAGHRQQRERVAGGGAAEPSGHRRQLGQRRSGVEEAVDPLARSGTVDRLAPLLCGLDEFLFDEQLDVGLVGLAHVGGGGALVLGEVIQRSEILRGQLLELALLLVERLELRLLLLLQRVVFVELGQLDGVRRTARRAHAHTHSHTRRQLGLGVVGRCC
mmetsp:Transcript_26116/g.64874  ORF Transcript_26116/g.64874 Transcript_26116/m.64874 type:complete len:350 (-) Transcript_26116:1743-2792(-)